jgi:GTPase SAR1 family protein
MAPFYFRGTSYCILVFDLSSIESLLALEKWIRLCNSLTINRDITYILVGNKSDINYRDVSKLQIEEFCLLHNITQYYETSAYKGDSVKLFYDDLVSLIKSEDDSIKTFVSTLPVESNESYCYCWG